MKSHISEYRELKEKYEILKQVNILLQKQIKSAQTKKDVSIQVDVFNNEIKQMISSIIESHCEEKRILKEQIQHLESKVHKIKTRKTLEQIQDIKNIYINKLTVSTPIRTALIELESIINAQKEYEISDLKYRLHFAENALKQPNIAFKQFDTDKLKQSINDCKEMQNQPENSFNIEEILNKLNKADKQWDLLFDEIYQEDSTLNSQLQSTFKNAVFELSFSDLQQQI